MNLNSTNVLLKPVPLEPFVEAEEAAGFSICPLNTSKNWPAPANSLPTQGVMDSGVAGSS